HALGPGAAGRRHQGEGAGGTTRRHPRGDPAAAEREERERGSRGGAAEGDDDPLRPDGGRGAAARAAAGTKEHGGQEDAARPAPGAVGRGTETDGSRGPQRHRGSQWVWPCVSVLLWLRDQRQSRHRFQINNLARRDQPPYLLDRERVLLQILVLIRL